MKYALHVELFETRGAKSMTTVNHDPRNTISCVIIFFTERAVVLIEELVDELIDFFTIEIWWVLGLLEKEGSWILKFFSH